MNDFLFFLIINGVTGISVIWVWTMLSNALKNFIPSNIQYIFLKLILLIFLIPFSSFTIISRTLSPDEGFVARDIDFINLTTTKVFQFLFLVWFIGFLVASLFLLSSYIKFRHVIIRKSFKITNSNLENLLIQLKTTTHCRRNVQLYQNDHIAVPVVIGIWNPKILVPLKLLSPPDLSVILLHELTHIRRHDLLFKQFCMISRCIHWFNPIVYYLSKKVNEWSEYSCDEITCAQGASLFKKKQYFTTMLRFSLNYSNAHLPAASLVEKRSEIERRIHNMKKHKITSLRLHLLTLFSCTVLFFSSSVTALAVNSELGARYKEWYFTTSNFTEIDYIPEEQVIVEEEVDEIPEFEDLIIQDALLDSSQVSVSLKPNAAYKSVAITKSSGQKISVALFSEPNSKPLKIWFEGPVKSSVISVTTPTSYQFTITKSGTYYVYVENTSTSTLSLTGMID